MEHITTMNQSAQKVLLILLGNIAFTNAMEIEQTPATTSALFSAVGCATKDTLSKFIQVSQLPEDVQKHIEDINKNTTIYVTHEVQKVKNNNKATYQMCARLMTEKEPWQTNAITYPIKSERALKIGLKLLLASKTTNTNGL